jgi:hypothetical protein
MTPPSMAALPMDSWQRRHCGSVLALAIWLNGRCEASVYEASGPLRVRERVACATTDDAKARADRLLRNAYPHDCDAEGCAPWAPFARAV